MTEIDVPAWRDAVSRLQCPLCGAGPFAVVAQHTRIAHGVTARHLRDLLLLPYRQSICDPAHSALMAQRDVNVAPPPALIDSTRGRDAGMLALHARRIADRKAVRRQFDETQLERSICELAEQQPPLTLALIGDRLGVSQLVVDRVLRQYAERHNEPPRPRTPKPPAVTRRFHCPECGAAAEAPLSWVERSRANNDAAERFCSRRCAALYRERKRRLGPIAEESTS